MEYNIYIGTIGNLHYQFTEDYESPEDAYKDAFNIMKKDFYEIKGRVLTKKEMSRWLCEAVATSEDHISESSRVGSKYM